MLEHETMQDACYKELFRRIEKSAYTPGEKLSINKLMEDTGYGKSAITNTLSRLQQEGLIHTIPKSGNFVSKISMKAMNDGRYVRAIVEKDLLKDAIALITDEDIQKIQKILDRQLIAEKNKDFEEFYLTDELFHRSFYEMTLRDSLWDWMMKLETDLNRYRWLRIKVSRIPLMPIIEQHIGIFEAVKAGNVELAGERMDAHHMTVISDQPIVFSEFPSYFE